MKRGDLVTVALSGDYGKPRPALIIQSDSFAELESVTILRITSELRNAPTLRLTINPSQDNGLRSTSQIMIDKAATLPREKVGQIIGYLDQRTMKIVSRALAVFLGLEEPAA